MKKILILLTLTTSICMVQSQNDTMYVYGGGIEVGKYQINDIDSIVFYQPALPTQIDTLNIESEQFFDMATRTANYTDANQKIPTIIYTDASQTRSVNAAEFYYMMSRWLRWIKANGETARPLPPVKIIRGIDPPPTPSGSMSGQFTKTDMLEKGESNANLIAERGYVPNYMTVNSVQYSPVAFFHAMAKTIRWFSANNYTLPEYTNLVEVAAPNDWPTPGLPPSGYDWNRTLNVPSYEQPDAYTCGPTSLRMVMAYYGTSKTVSQISDYMASWGDSPYYDGVAPNAIIAAAKHYGFSSTVTQYGWDNLKKAIAAGHPVIANIQILGNSYPRYYPSNNPAYTGSYGHYVVVVGLEATTDGSVKCVVVNDPARGAVKYTTASFETSWVNNKNRLMIRLK
jgi:predicted double-glycine peptidase